MSKKDIFGIAVGCLAWVAAITLVVLMFLGILDFEMILDIFCYVIIGIALILLLLLSILLALRN